MTNAIESYLVRIFRPGCSLGGLSPAPLPNQM
jgi:hypothetical protein